MNSTTPISENIRSTSELDVIRDKEILLEAVDVAVRISLRKLGLVQEYISQRSACDLLGVTTATLKTWENKGWIKSFQIGGKGKKITYSRTELETVERLIKQGRLK